MLNKKVILCTCLLLAVPLLVTSCNSKEKEDQDQIVFTQSNIENNIESSDYESVDNSEKDEEFYKRLLLRLIQNEILITDGENQYYFSDTVSTSYEAMLPESEFYIVDINGDKKLDIGIKFPTNVLETFYYNPETDTLSMALDDHIYTEILGNRQVMTASQTAMRTSYFYSVINILGEKISTVAFTEDYVGESILSDGTKKANFSYSVELRMSFLDGTKRPNRTTSTTEVTKEQWDMMKKPFDDLRKNAPKPFDYEELMAVES